MTSKTMKTLALVGFVGLSAASTVFAGEAAPTVEAPANVEAAAEVAPPSLPGVSPEGVLVCDDVDCQLTCEAQNCLGGACTSHGACRCIGC